MLHRHALLALLVVASACDDSTPQGAGRSLSRQEVAEIRRAVAASLGTGLATGYGVAVWRDGEVIYAEGFGTVHETGAKVTNDTLFQIGSDTKKLTALALLEEVERGVVTLEDTVSELVPELVLASDADYLSNLTVSDLLTHRSGMYDYTPWYDAAQDSALRDTVFGRFAAEQHAMLPPGIAWNYSNANYALLGFLLEELSGKAYPDVIASAVLEPLGLVHTYVRRDDMLAAETDMASGHGSILREPGDFFSPLDVPELERGWLLPREQPDHAFTRPAGMVWSTASDQARLLGFFVDGDETVLSDELREAMFEKHTPLLRHIESPAYGQAFLVEDGFLDADGAYRATRVVEHGGNTMTMTSSSMFLPKERVAVSVLANGQLENLGGVSRTALHMAARTRLPPETRPPSFPAAARDLTGYAGDFADRNLGDVTLTLRDQALAIDVPVLDALGVSYARVLEPLYLDLFTWQVEGASLQLDFYDAPFGSARSYAVNRSFVLSRRSDSPASRRLFATARALTHGSLASRVLTPYAVAMLRSGR